jgi:hypothetical protein
MAVDHNLWLLTTTPIKQIPPTNGERALVSLSLSDHWSHSPFKQTHSPALTCRNIVKAQQYSLHRKEWTGPRRGGGMNGIKFRHRGIFGSPSNSIKVRVSLHSLEASRRQRVDRPLVLGRSSCRFVGAGTLRFSGEMPSSARRKRRRSIRQQLVVPEH